MIKTYNNTEYYFDELKSILKFINTPYILPISIWLEVCKEIYNTWSDSIKRDILNSMINRANIQSNMFLYNDVKCWLDKDLRSSILTLLETYTEDTFSLVLYDSIVDMPTDKARKFIENLNLYSYKCLIAYSKIKNNLEKYEDANFDFPEPLNLNDYLQ